MGTVMSSTREPEAGDSGGDKSKVRPNSDKHTLGWCIPEQAPYPLPGRETSLASSGDLGQTLSSNVTTRRSVGGDTGMTGAGVDRKDVGNVTLVGVGVWSGKFRYDDADDTLGRADDGTFRWKVEQPQNVWTLTWR